MPLGAGLTRPNVLPRLIMTQERRLQFGLLQAVIQIADDALESLSTWGERSAWLSQHRGAYIALAELELRKGNQQAALDIWEHFRVADPRQLANNRMPT